MQELSIQHLVQIAFADAIRDTIKPAVESALADSLPAILRRASLPVYLTTKELAELTGWSERKIGYLKAERRIPFIRRGRTVLFPTAEVEAYLDEGRVSAKVGATEGKVS